MNRTIKPEQLKTQISGKIILDVRRESDLASSSEKLANAQWKNPEQISVWAEQLPKDKEIVLYCVRGGGVSNSVVDALQAKGLNACFIEGGIEGWKTAGGAVVAR